MISPFGFKLETDLGAFKQAFQTQKLTLHKMSNACTQLLTSLARCMSDSLSLSGHGHIRRLWLSPDRAALHRTVWRGNDRQRARRHRLLLADGKVVGVAGGQAACGHGQRARVDVASGNELLAQLADPAVDIVEAGAQVCRHLPARLHQVVAVFGFIF